MLYGVSIKSVVIPLLIQSLHILTESSIITSILFSIHFSNFNEVLLSEYLIHDKELREKGIINKNAEYIRKGMFDWSEIEEENFYKENIERIARKLDLIEGAKEYINKLHEDGNTISGEDKVFTTNLEKGSAETDVVNKSGKTLPTTGGMGTTIFYVVGSILVLGAAILLITKKRMSAR